VKEIKEKKNYGVNSVKRIGRMQGMGSVKDV